MISVVNLGTMPYQAALDLQRAAASARISGALSNDVLLLVEHPPVVTLGRGTKAGNLVGSAALLKARGVELFEVERGGDITYHGPGQLVGYPVFDLKQHKQDLHWYLRQVEEALIQALLRVGLPSLRNPGFTGVWTGGAAHASAGHRQGLHGAAAAHTGPTSPGLGLRKIASIGVHAREWITWHGFALNVTTDLSNFELIVPCGIKDVTMTTVQRELYTDFPGEEAVRDAVISAFSDVFGSPAQHRSPHWLRSALERVPIPNA